MRTVTVSCPQAGRIEVDVHDVVYERNGDGTGTYEFPCVACRADHMRHATIADMNQFRIQGVRHMPDLQIRERLDARIDEAEAAAFALELEFTDSIVEEARQ